MALAMVLVLGMGCSQKAQEAGKGAAAGALAGALAGVVLAAITGNVEELVVLGAALGAGIGAGEGATSVRSDAKYRPERPGPASPAYRAELERMLGPEAYAGIKALAWCDYDRALAHARVAATSARRDHALAGAWVGAITEADAGRTEAATRWLEAAAEQDTVYDTPEEAQETLGLAVHELREIRYAYGHEERCARGL